MSMIVAETVSRHFPNEPRPAVDRVSFQIDTGSFVVLLGPSGCGKTTLLKLINRLYEPTAGRILIDGVDIHDQPATALRRQIGYVIQQVGLFPHMRIGQNIATVPQLLGWERQRIDRRIEELLELVGLPLSYRARYPRQLSGGEQQRVGLARALAADPAIMLMDEPFGALDAITRARLQDELLSIQQKLHKTILFVTHDVDEALRLADKIIIMRAGQIVQADPPLQILRSPHDTFVRDLVGADDILRHLRLIKVGALVTRLAPAGLTKVPADTPTISTGDDLRSALVLLLGSRASELRVVDAAGQQIGTLTFADLQTVLGADISRHEQIRGAVLQDGLPAQ